MTDMLLFAGCYTCSVHLMQHYCNSLMFDLSTKQFVKLTLLMLLCCDNPNNNYSLLSSLHNIVITQYINE